MIAFKPVTLCDKPWVDELVALENSPSADYNFGNIYIWDKHYRQLIARCGDRMLTKLRYNGERAFVFPIGAGPLRPAVEALREFAAAKGYPLVIRGVMPGHRELLEAEYPGRFTYTPEEDTWDYLYPAEKLATYSGKAMHGKKNHCNRFEAENSWEFKPLTYDLIPGCLDMLDLWSEDNSERLDPSVHFEHDAIIRAFAAYEWLGLEGGVLFANGEIVGFSIGELCASNTFDVHFEKARIDMNGAYPMVCRELTKLVLQRHPDVVYMNREDDMGLDALRQSKQSYKPVAMVEKYTARWNND